MLSEPSPGELAASLQNNRVKGRGSGPRAFGHTESLSQWVAGVRLGLGSILDIAAEGHLDMRPMTFINGTGLTDLAVRLDRAKLRKLNLFGIVAVEAEPPVNV